MYAKLSQQIGTNVRAARHRAGLSQTQVAEAIHVPTLVFSRLERGRLLPSLPTLVGLCGVLRVSVDFILCGKALEAPAPDGSGT
ncbi:DNA-binding protein [Corallococcus coralloides]|uniref:DNA-binding protein n=1 Tax=Corallococcus coralloides TaxID=184914 RepID=A0A410RS80_CORCK|nr:helix-turn-helix transcriptional regulator [Corallococcus coralloides]QAT84757.1 DNA-binding protein [Corallococcus coralloides]